MKLMVRQRASCPGGSRGGGRVQTVWLPTLFDQEPAQATPAPLSDTQQSSEPPGRTQGCPEVAAVPRDTERASPLQDAVTNISPSCYSSWGVPLSRTLLRPPPQSPLGQQAPRSAVRQSEPPQPSMVSPSRPLLDTLPSQTCPQ